MAFLDLQRPRLGVDTLRLRLQARLHQGKRNITVPAAYLLPGNQGLPVYVGNELAQGGAGLRARHTPLFLVYKQTIDIALIPYAQ